MTEVITLGVTDAWQAAYPGAGIGVLTMHNVANPDACPDLEVHKAALENRLRHRYGGLDRAGIKALPVIEAYTAYYKRFKKTYHVQHQLESVVLKERPIASTAPLVEAMFMAELEHLLLTAGHDLDIAEPPVTINVADGSESFTGIRGDVQTLKPQDMYIADTIGILSTIIYGPDQRTMIRPETHNVLFTVYAPAGIGVPAVEEHLRSLRDYVRIVSPEAEVGRMKVYA